MKADYKKTVNACFIGYIVQAVVNNFVPLLFLTFQSQYGIPLSKITFLITFNFSIQLVIDLLAAKFVDKIGYRASALSAHASAALGLCMLAFLPELTKDPFIGILISVVVYAVGGGLLEVIVSPIVEACPTDNKEAAMSLLHSFYCWGHVGVVLLSTMFFRFVGIGHWKILACLWALVPLLNMLAFFKVPIAPIIEEGGQGLSFKELLKNKVFWLLMLLMLCAGSCEQAVSQWASAFAEAGLGISKTAGDLAGPMFFAIMMGLSRAFYGKYGDKMDLVRFMKISGVLCLCSYLLISLSPVPVPSLIGCGLCGLSVGILWPGTFSLGSAGIKGGGTMMFAFFALAGDVGCSVGPTYVGTVTSLSDGNMKQGILFACVFPILLLAGLMAVRKVVENKENPSLGIQ
ncbi:MFS transporter [Roseburia sp. BX1005]|uniref:MFS transporter n=1 Tax=Roseburia zhanii TaxID=2763064 RepID=A0A923LPT9_9FIRM|nr:MFS transporter [Roseburia zhanii]MBC5714135.1 MFS transporter [Roseburia zhanii]